MEEVRAKQKQVVSGLMGRRRPPPNLKPMSDDDVAAAVEKWKARHGEPEVAPPSPDSW